MMFNKKISAFGLTSAILFSAATAFAEGESVEAQQTSLLQKLDSLNAAVLGLKLNGNIKAGGLTSMAKSDQFSDDSPTQENQAYTDANLVLTARPSSETQIHLELRLHKDWQNAFDENNNPVIGHWFSYDGSILNKHLDFNLGYMRVGFTPYTLYTPQQKLLQEPEIFAQKRVEALAMRNLDTTSNRLMQGLNADFHSGNVGPFSDIHAQATGARMRNTAKKYDQVFFDFDFSDRYFYGLRLGADAFGAHLGVNYTDVFDREKSRRSRAIAKSDTVYYEDNAVVSAEIGFDSKELLSNLPVSFGLNGELAKSWWSVDRDYVRDYKKQEYALTEFTSKMDPAITNPMDTSFIYIKVSESTKQEEVHEEEIFKDDGMAFYVEPFVNLDIAGIEGSIKVMYLQNDEKFWSEMASSPVYRGGTSVLNANALFKDANYTSLVDEFGMASLENMYLAVYNSNPLNATNLMTSYSKNVLTDDAESNNMYSRLFNNYKSAHFYRNGYNADVLKRLELADQNKALFLMDPANDMSLPMGVATPDRKGLNVNVDLNWNSAVELNAIFGMISTVSSDVEEIKYTRYGAGLGVDVGRIAGLDRKIKVQGSYDHSEEDKGFQRKNDRIMAGLNVDVVGPLALLAGYQMSTREFGIAYPVSGSALINKAEESLLLAGPRVKIAPNSYLSVQYGLLTDKVTFLTIDLATGAPANQELSIDKNVIIADVTVNF
jgi:hypothetical protein